MDSSNNIIVFPRKSKLETNIVQCPQSLEDVADTVDVVREAHMQQALEQIVPMLFDNLALAGFQPLDDFEMLKDGTLIVESMRSFMSKLYGMDHPLQLIAENLFVQIDPDGTLEVSDKIKIIITPVKDE